jgi:3'-phosphoadenosine 5'-phosphosulfate sulfotransferase (PAPS reductase)/FAD synthetase
MLDRKFNEKYVLSFGAGLNSTALMIMIIEKKYPLDEVIFADTGGETPETYAHLKVTEEYLRLHNVPLRIVASKNGTLYDTCNRRKVIPSQVWRWCTRDKKITPIHFHYRNFDAPVIQYLGISYEERDRAKESGNPLIKNKFPLIENKIDRQGCMDTIMMADFDFPAPSRSGCFFCPFNSISRWREIYEKHKELFLKAKELEENSKHFPKQRLMKWTLETLQEKLEQNESLPDIYVKRVCSSECII